jgi:hypothetical protein
VVLSEAFKAETLATHIAATPSSVLAAV